MCRPMKCFCHVTKINFREVTPAYFVGVQQSMNALWRVQFRTYSDIVGISNLKMCLTRKDDDQVASLEHLPMPMVIR